MCCYQEIAKDFSWPAAGYAHFQDSLTPSAQVLSL